MSPALQCVLIAAALVALVVGAVAVVVGLRERSGDAASITPPSASWLDSVTRERVIVHTIDEQTVEGLLVDVHDDGIVLATPRLVGPGHTLAGDLWIPRPKIRFVQRATAADLEA